MSENSSIPVKRNLNNAFIVLEVLNNSLGFSQSEWFVSGKLYHNARLLRLTYKDLVDKCYWENCQISMQNQNICCYFRNEFTTDKHRIADFNRDPSYDGWPRNVVRAVSETAVLSAKEAENVEMSFSYWLLIICSAKGKVLKEKAASIISTLQKKGVVEVEWLNNIPESIPSLLRMDYSVEEVADKASPTVKNLIDAIRKTLFIHINESSQTAPNPTPIIQGTLKERFCKKFVELVGKDPKGWHLDKLDVNSDVFWSTLEKTAKKTYNLAILEPSFVYQINKLKPDAPDEVYQRVFDYLKYHLRIDHDSMVLDEVQFYSPYDKMLGRAINSKEMPALLEIAANATHSDGHFIDGYDTLVEKLRDSFFEVNQDGKWKFRNQSDRIMLYAISRAYDYRGGKSQADTILEMKEKELLEYLFVPALDDDTDTIDYLNNLFGNQQVYARAFLQQFGSIELLYIFKKLLSIALDFSAENRVNQERTIACVTYLLASPESPIPPAFIPRILKNTFGYSLFRFSIPIIALIKTRIGIDKWREYVDKPFIKACQLEERTDIPGKHYVAAEQPFYFFIEHYCFARYKKSRQKRDPRIDHYNDCYDTRRKTYRQSMMDDECDTLGLSQIYKALSGDIDTLRYLFGLELLTYGADKAQKEAEICDVKKFQKYAFLPLYAMQQLLYALSNIRMADAPQKDSERDNAFKHNAKFKDEARNLIANPKFIRNVVFADWLIRKSSPRYGTEYVDGMNLIDGASRLFDSYFDTINICVILEGTQRDDYKKYLGYELREKVFGNLRYYFILVRLLCFTDYFTVSEIQDLDCRGFCQTDFLPYDHMDFSDGNEFKASLIAIWKRVHTSSANA